MKAKPKSRVGVDNPLDAYDTTSAGEALPPRAAKGGRAAPKKAAPAPAAAKGANKERSTFHLPPDLMDEVRNAVYACSGPPLRLTLAGLVESALRRSVAELQKSHNKGKPFPQRGEELRGGRPMRS